jgi:hypothetical protein
MTPAHAGDAVLFQHPKEFTMIKRLLPLLIGLSICTVATAQTAPATAQSASTTTTTTLTTTKVSSWATQPPEGALSEADVKAAIATAGFQEVKGLEFKDGVWRSKARGGNKQWVKLAVGPVNGKVYVDEAPSKLNKDEISAVSTQPESPTFLSCLRRQGALFRGESRSSGDLRLPGSRRDWVLAFARMRGLSRCQSSPGHRVYLSLPAFVLLINK